MALTDLAWYNDMRAAYPSDTEDWLWPMDTPYEVVVDGVNTNVRRYLWEQLIGTGEPPVPFYPSPTCRGRCVNPNHMLSQRIRHGRRTRTFTLDYATVDAMKEAIHGAVGFGKTRADVYEAGKQLAMSGAPFDKRAWEALVPVVARNKIHGNSDVWSASLDAGVYIDLTTVPAEAVAGMPADYALSTGQPPLEEM